MNRTFARELSSWWQCAPPPSCSPNCPSHTDSCSCPRDPADCQPGCPGSTIAHSSPPPRPRARLHHGGGRRAMAAANSAAIQANGRIVVAPDDDGHVPPPAWRALRTLRSSWAARDRLLRGFQRMRIITLILSPLGSRPFAWQEGGSECGRITAFLFSASGSCSRPRRETLTDRLQLSRRPTPPRSNPMQYEPRFRIPLRGQLSRTA